MAPLKNHRHEIFVYLLAQGETAVDAHQKAGYARSDANASRLRNNPKVVSRLAELQTEVVKETKITVESICAELDEANRVAKEKGQASAMVSVSALRAKLAGLGVERQQIEVHNRSGPLDGLNTVDEIIDGTARHLLSEINWWHDVREQDYADLVAIMRDGLDRIDACIKAIKQRPHIANYQQGRPVLPQWNGKNKRD